MKILENLKARNDKPVRSLFKGLVDIDIKLPKTIVIIAAVVIAAILGGILVAVIK